MQTLTIIDRQDLAEQIAGDTILTETEIDRIIAQLEEMGLVEWSGSSGRWLGTIVDGDWYTPDGTVMTDDRWDRISRTLPEPETLTPGEAADLVASLSDRDDPLDVYRRATSAERTLREAAEEASAWRARALARAHVGGLSYGQIAERVGTSRARVQQLVERGR